MLCLPHCPGLVSKKAYKPAPLTLAINNGLIYMAGSALADLDAI